MSTPSPLRQGRTGLLVVAFACLGCLGCPQRPLPPVRVGLVTYDPSSMNGLATSNGALLAEEEANAGGGVLVGGQRRRVEFRRMAIREGNAEQAVAAVQKLINQEKVCAVLGPQNSDEAIPAGGVAERSKVPLISPISSNAQTTLGRSFVFRAGFRDEDQGKALARFARGTLKARTAGLLWEVNVVYSRTIAEVFRREFVAQGGRVVADERYPDGLEDISRPLQTIRRAAPDVLLLTNYNQASGRVGTTPESSASRTLPRLPNALNAGR